MRNSCRILVNLLLLALLFFNAKDKAVLKDNSSYYTGTTVLEDTEPIIRENIKLGIMKQSLLRLEYSVGEPRDL